MLSSAGLIASGRPESQFVIALASSQDQPDVQKAVSDASAKLTNLKVIESENAPSLYNDPKLTERVAGAIGRAIGPDNAIRGAPLMASEDFGRLSLDHQIPSCMVWLGAIEPSRVEASRKSGKPLPSLHSSLFQPLPEPTLRTGVKAMTSAVLELLKK